MMGFEFLRAEADANTLRERQLRTVKLNAEKGRPHGRLPYGYRRVYDEHTGVLLRQEPDPHKATIVREAVQGVLEGRSLHSIAMKLQDAGEPTPMKTWTEAPQGWQAKTVRQVLQNPTIAGKRVYRGEVIGDALWEPLVSWEDFQRVQRLLADPVRRAKGGGGIPALTLLTHIARCHYCGRPLKRAVLRRKNKADGVKYCCAFRGCYKITIAQPGLDTYVESAALAWFEQPVNLARLTAEDDGTEWLAKVKVAEDRRAELQARLDEAVVQYAAGGLNLDTLTKVEQTLRPQIAEAERDLIPRSPTSASARWSPRPTSARPGSACRSANSARSSRLLSTFASSRPGIADRTHSSRSECCSNLASAESAQAAVWSRRLRRTAATRSPVIGGKSDAACRAASSIRTRSLSGSGPFASADIVTGLSSLGR